jgi:hypothetical protein
MKTSDHFEGLRLHIHECRTELADAGIENRRPRALEVGEERLRPRCQMRLEKRLLLTQITAPSKSPRISPDIISHSAAM